MNIFGLGENRCVISKEVNILQNQSHDIDRHNCSGWMILRVDDLVLIGVKGKFKAVDINQTDRFNRLPAIPTFVEWKIGERVLTLHRNEKFYGAY